MELGIREGVRATPAAAVKGVKHARRAARPNGWLAIGLALAGLAALELLLQVRAHFLTGESIFKPRPEAAAPVVRVEGLPLLPPNTVIRGAEMEVRTNRLGLRSPEIGDRPAPGEMRLAVIGASTVFGAYAPTNEDTFAQQLAALLRQRHAGPVNVINASVEGLTVRQMGLMLDRVVAPLGPRRVFIYTGFNDVARLCRLSAGEGGGAVQAPWPALPTWLLVPELVRKNTLALRTSYRLTGSGLRRSNRVSPEAIAAYRRDVEALAQTARRRGVELVFVSSLTSYRRELPLAEQRAMSAFALYYNKCLDLNGLYRVTDQLNRIQQEAAQAHGFDFLDVRADMPGGRAMFVDSSHFTVAGERRMAEALNRYLAGREG